MCQINWELEGGRLYLEARRCGPYNDGNDTKRRTEAGVPTSVVEYKLVGMLAVPGSYGIGVICERGDLGDA